MKKTYLSLLAVMLCFGSARASETWMFMEEYPWIWSSDRNTWVYAVTNEGQLVGYYTDTENWEDIGISEEVETSQNDTNRIMDFYHMMYWRNGESTDLIMILSEVTGGVKTEFLRLDLQTDVGEDGLHGIRPTFDDPVRIQQFLIDSEDAGSITYIDLPSPPILDDSLEEPMVYSEPKEFDTEYPLFNYTNYVVEVIDSSDHSGFSFNLTIGN